MSEARRLRLNQLIGSQHGVIGRSQVRALGYSNGFVDAVVRRGDWERIDTGVFRHTAVPMNWHGRVLAACLALDAVASHRSAAALHGLAGYSQGHVEVTVPTRKGRLRRDIVIHESLQSDRFEIEVRDRVRTTGLARTVLDLAGVVSRHRLDRTVDDVIRRGVLRWVDLHSVLYRHSRQGRDGCGKLRELLEQRADEERPPESDWSRDFAEMLHDAWLPLPKLEHRVIVDSIELARVDLAYPDQRLAIELDSIQFHLDRVSFEKDRQRWNRLTAAGWTVLNFTWSDTRDHPKRSIEIVRAALRRSTAENRTYQMTTSENSV